MATAFSHIVPVLLAFGLGHALRRLGVARRSDGDFLFKLVFYVCVPGLAFSSLAQVEITRQLLVFPLLAGLLTSIGYFVGKWLSAVQALPKERAATFALTCAIVNSAFALSFAQALYGHVGVARVAVFDTVNNIVVYGGLYAVAAKANPTHSGESVLIGKLLRSPPVYAVLLGLGVNAFDIQVPSVIGNTANSFGAPTGFLVALATGIVFTLNYTDFRLSAEVLGLRLVIGMAFAGFFIAAFRLHGADQTLVTLLALSPVGFNSVTFSSLENLDVDFAAGTLSISLIVSLVLATGVSTILG